MISQSPEKRGDSEDFLYRITSLTVPKTAGTWRDTTFGIPEYGVPIRDHFRPRIRGCTKYLEKQKRFIPVVENTTLYKTTPGPSAKYDMVWDWRKKSSWRKGAFDQQVGNFLKKPR